jgi:very-short-patch-repair endonuclease
VLVFAGTADTLLTRSLVAGHAVHPDGGLTGLSALAVRAEIELDPWSILETDPIPWLRIAGHRRVPARVLRCQPGPAHDLLGVRVVPVDTAARDLLRFLPVREARALMYRLAQVRGKRPTSELLDRACDEAGPGRGSRQLRSLQHALAEDAHSEAERELLRLLREAGITGFVANLPVRVAGRVLRIDVAFPDPRLAIEVDGRAYHSSADRFQADRTRQNKLVNDGWRVLRFTWADIMQRPEMVVAQIRSALAPA